jgi:hypothetical protein
MDQNERDGSRRPLALTKTQAAETLSMSVDTFERHVMADLKVVRVGRKVLVPVRECERWIEENAARTIEAA